MSIFGNYVVVTVVGLVGVFALGMGVQLYRCAPYRKLPTRRG